MIIAKINSKNKKFNEKCAYGSTCNCGSCNCNCGSQYIEKNVADEKIRELLK